MRHVLSGAAAAVAMFFIAAAPASASPLAASAMTEVGQVRTGLQAETVQYRRYYGGRGYYGPRYGYRRGWRGDGVAAGVAAGALGALAIGAIAAQQQQQYAPIAPGRKQWCADRYRSYDPASGTYIDNRGRQRFCG